MTRARTASHGVGTPPPLDRWIDAVLMLFVSLVQGVATTFGMGRWIRARDWHTRSGSSALPQTKPDIHLKEEDSLPESRAALRQTSLLEHARGQADAPSEDHNRESQKLVTELLEAGKARVPGEGRGPARNARSSHAQPRRSFPPERANAPAMTEHVRPHPA